MTKERINSQLKDVWHITRVVKMTEGLSLGLFQYTYLAFLFDHFGGDSRALTLSVVLATIGAVYVLLTEVPTGAVGDHIGRRRTVLLSFILRSIALALRVWLFFIPSITASFILATISSIFFAISYTFFSGSFVAWIVDTVKERGVHEGHGGLIARSYGHMIFAKVLGAMLGVAFYLSGYYFFAFSVGCIAYILCALYCGITMKETEHISFYRGKFFVRDSFDRMKEIIKTGWAISLRTPPILYVMLLHAAFMTMTLIVLFLWPIAMKANFGVEKMSPYWFLIVLLSFVVSFVGAKSLEELHHRYKKQKNEKVSDESLWKWMVFVCIAMASLIFFLGFSSSQGLMTLTLFVAMIALFNFGYGFIQPAYETLLNHCIPPQHAKERATIISFGSMLLEALMILLLIPSSGSSGETTTIGWMLPASILLITSFALHVLMRRHQRKIRTLPERKKPAMETENVD